MTMSVIFVMASSNVIISLNNLSERRGAERHILVLGCDGEGASAGDPCLCLVCLSVPGGSRLAGPFKS